MSILGHDLPQVQHEGPARHLQAPATTSVVPDLTVVFTDLGGSSALYHSLGDGAAFALVRHHFAVLRRAVQEAGGTVVKTIGDAVMAVFPHPLPALRAAVAALREAERPMPGAETVPPLPLKVGIQRGPVIAAMLENGVDYFGHTVNVAARLRGLAGAGGICMEAALARGEGMHALLTGLAVEAENARLPGLEGPELALLRLRLPPSQALPCGAAA